MERTEAEILQGIAPGVGPIVLGGREYASREPSILRTQRVMALQGEYDDLSKAAPASAREQMIRLNSIMVEIAKAFSAEIEEDWTRIENEATTEELLTAVGQICTVVGIPFVKRALAASPPQNRAARRNRKK